MTWGEGGFLLFCIITASLITGFIEASYEQRKKRREEKRKWQLKRKEAADSER